MGMAITSAFPNPFNSGVDIRYSLSYPMDIRVEVYDILGKRVCCLMDKYKDIGTYHIQFQPNHLTSGYYFIVLSNRDGLADSYKVVYLK
jgi:hypothetical protein